MSLQGVRKVALLSFISVFILYGCGAQIKLHNPKSITSKIGNNVIEVVDIGHYGNFFEGPTGINFDNVQNFRDDVALPANYAETFDINNFDLGFMDKFIVEVNIANYPKKDSFLAITFQTSESIFNSVKTNIKADLLSKKDLELLFQGEYKAFILNADNTSEYYCTNGYIDEDFNGETSQIYNEYKRFRPIIEKNFAAIKEWVDNKGWEKDYWYIRRMPDRSFSLFKGVQTESSVSRSVPFTP